MLKLKSNKFENPYIFCICYINIDIRIVCPAKTYSQLSTNSQCSGKTFNSNSTQIALDFCGIFRFSVFLFEKNTIYFPSHLENVSLKLFVLSFFLLFSFRKYSAYFEPMTFRKTPFFLCILLLVC